MILLVSSDSSVTSSEDEAYSKHVTFAGLVRTSGSWLLGRVLTMVSYYVQDVKSFVDPTGHFVQTARKVCDPRRETGVMERLLWLWMVLFLWMGVALSVDGTAMTVGYSVITTEFGLRTLLLRHAVATQMSYSRLRGRFSSCHAGAWKYMKRSGDASVATWLLLRTTAPL